MAGGQLTDLPNNIKALLAAQDDVASRPPSTDRSMGNSSKVNQLCSLPNRPKRMFSKLWSSNKSASEKR
ncbi:hypothetical protein L2E82_44482 [Cichorium intybus]|uniref:Uncharacterized protein n=1 Tax=Cichorium intybus TaxID=13427 RepID=A0ACB8ZQ88_CICIN|nr:hypothetical protein L2E82_44482 [Cichorium intybus]